MFDRAYTAILMATKSLIVVLFALMIVVTFAQVVFRYVAGAPISWSEELARYCFVWIVFLAAALGLERGVHLGLDLIVLRLPLAAQRVAAALCEATIIAFCLTVLVASLPVIEINAFQRSPSLGLRMSHVYLVIPIAMALLSLVAAKRLVARLQAG